MAKRNNQNEDESDNFENADDTFGLPEIEYEPLNREEGQELTTPEDTQSSSGYESQDVYQETTYHNRPEPEEGTSAWPKVLGIGLILILLAGGGYYYVKVYKPKKEAERIAKEKALEEKEAAERAALAAREAEQRRLEDERRRADSLANATPAIGAIETLSERTGRYYVVIASSIDGDLVMDYAKKLSPKGVSSKIIPPHGSVKFHRLTIATGDSYSDTQTVADGLKDQYGPDVWVTKY